MNCPQCGRANPVGMSFCGNCGAGLINPVTPQSGPQPSTTQGMTPVGVGFQPKKNEALPWMLGGAVALIFALLLMGASGMLRLGGKAGNQNLGLNGEIAGPALQARASLDAPPLSQEKSTMPKDVYDWLKHLEKCEKAKEDLVSEQMNGLMVDKNRMGAAEGLTPGDVGKLSDPEGGVDLPEGLKSTFDHIANMGKDWERIKEKFDSLPPPAECRPIAEAYDNGLSGMISAINQVSQIAGGSSDPNKPQDDPGATSSTSNLHNLSKNHVADVDVQLQKTDDLVDEICKKYSVLKWFKIDAHGAGASPIAGVGG